MPAPSSSSPSNSAGARSRCRASACQARRRWCESSERGPRRPLRASRGRLDCMPGPADFRWSIPERFNIGVDVADRHAARGNDTALIEVDASGKVTTFGFRDVVRLANRLANLLRAEGIERGDRVAVLLPQRHETAIVHVAAYKAGFVAVPLFTLFGEEALEFRLQNGEARAIVTDAEGAAKIGRLRDRLPALKLVLCADGPADGAVDLHAAVERASDRFEAVDTDAEEPAVLIYTSGTTGQPKGALHAHRVLLGHLPGVEYPHDNFPQPGDRFWTPADWAWIGGLYDVLLPAWHHGVAVVAYRARKFVPGEALDLMARQGVRNVFMPPTALKLLRASGARKPGVRLRSLASGGESLGEDLIEWGRETFGLTINEFYGQTECNLVVGNGGGLPPSSESGTPSAPKWSRRSSCSSPATPDRRPLPRSCRNTSAPASPRTSTRASWSSSPSCRSPRRGRSSAGRCARLPPPSEPFQGLRAVHTGTNQRAYPRGSRAQSIICRKRSSISSRGTGVVWTSASVYPSRHASQMRAKVSRGTRSVSRTR